MSAPRATLVVILARGLGSRLRTDDGAALSAEQQAAAASGTKGLMPIAGRPFLDHILDALADGGVTDAVFVVAPGASPVRAYFDAHAHSRVRVQYAVQDEPRGTADALRSARAAVTGAGGAPRDTDGARHFLMCNADNLYPAPAVRALVEADGPAVIAFDADALVADGLIEPGRVARFALMDITPDGALREIVEKPSADHPLMLAPGKSVSMNIWRFTDAIFDDCDAVQPSPRGELELQDAVRRAIARGTRIAAIPQRLAVLDLTHRRDVAALEARLAHRPASA